MRPLPAPCCLAFALVAAGSPCFAARTPQHIVPAAPNRNINYHSLRSHRDEQWDIVAAYPVFKPNTALAKSANWKMKAWAAERVKAFLIVCQRAEASSFKQTAPYELKISAVVGADTPALKSVVFTASEYTGGAHGLTTYIGMTFGTVRGKPRVLALHDLFLPRIKPASAMTPLAIPLLRAQSASYVKDGTIAKLTPELLTNWVVTPQGISLLFAPYTLGPYSDGAFTAKIPFDSLRGRLNPRGALRGLLTAKSRN